jgi:hypothetical protein
VWEWTLAHPSDGSGAPGFATRGGAYFFDAFTALASNRQVASARLRDPTIGVRLCADAPAGATISRPAESAR